jgi:hypothetical protein
MRRWCRAELLMGHLVGRSIRLPLCGTRADSRLTQAAVDCLSDYRDIRVEVAAPTLARRRGVGAGHRVATAQSDPARLPRPMVVTPKRSPSLDWWHGVNESSTLGPGAPASRLEAPRAAERVDARAGAERGGDAPRAAARLRVAGHSGRCCTSLRVYGFSRNSHRRVERSRIGQPVGRPMRAVDVAHRVQHLC